MRTLEPSLTHEGEGGDCRKSEAGRRFEIADRGNMTRDFADSVHDNAIYPFHTAGAIRLPVKASNWEPDQIGSGLASNRVRSCTTTSSPIDCLYRIKGVTSWLRHGNVV